VSEPRPRTPRLALGLALVLVGLVDVHALLQSLRTQERLRERASRGARQALAVATAPVRATLPQGPARAVELARRLTGALSAELFSDAGKRLARSPDGAPVTHRPSAEELQRLLGGDLVTVGPLAGDPPRLLTYVTLRDTAGMRFLLRISTTAPELVEDMRERRLLWLGHGVSLTVLLVAAVLVLFPGPEASAVAQGGVLAAYEEAMGRLRDHGAAVDREHRRERRRMEEEIQLKEAMARAGELAAGMAHEVRNGLATIVGYARLAERSSGTDASSQAVAAILEECRALEATVRRLMDYVRKEQLELHPFDPLRMLSRVAGRESREETEMVAPAAGGGETIVGDEELLERAFENLVRNAREAAGAGGHVWIRGERRGPGYHVFVADDGPGLPKEEKDGLRPFHSTKPGGLGLGLPMALKIVRLHHGELLLRDRVPRGLEVEVRLPAGGPSPESSVTDGSAWGDAGGGRKPV
jgi:signal transduction histidine kinase